MGNPLPLNLAQECRKAEKIITEFVNPAHGGLDRVIPMSVLRRAQGFAIFTVARLGFLMSARAGSGVVVARLADDSWSPPSALGLGGLGAGFNAGLDVTDFLIVLNSKQAVRSFMATGSLQVGGNLSVAVGPLGRAAEASGNLNSSGNIAAMFSYSKSKGLYGGVSLEGTVLVDRSDANSKAYHRSVTAKQILEGSVEMPHFAGPLISLIEKHTLTGEAGAGVGGYSRPGRGYDSGRRSSWDRNEMSDSDGLDSLDRDLRRTRITRTPSPRDSFSSLDHSYNDDRRNDYRDGFPSVPTSGSGEYAFASGVGPDGKASPHNSKKPSFGSRSSFGNMIGRSTDYKRDEVDLEYDARLHGHGKVSYASGRGSNASNDTNSGTFARAGVQSRSKPSPSSKLIDRDSSDYIGASSARAAASFPTQFQQSDSSTDDLQIDRSHKSSSRPSASSSQSRDPFKDLIDLGGARSNEPFGSTSRSSRSGLDELDRELQGRGSLSASEDHDDFAADTVASRPRLSSRLSSGTSTPAATKGWRSDYGLPDEDFAGAPAAKRPPLHARTSSAQKLWNRVRGNSNASKNTPSPNFAETWENRQRARDWERMNGEDADYSINRTSSASPAQSRRAMRSTSPSVSRPLRGTAGGATPPPAAIVAAALGRSNNSTPRAGGPLALATENYRNDSNEDWASFGAEGSSRSNGGFLSFKSSNAQDGDDNFGTYAVEQQVVALFDFAGQEQDDLSFKRGDVIDILRKTESREDWWLGRCRGQIGNLPANFTKDV